MKRSIKEQQLLLKKKKKLGKRLIKFFLLKRYTKKRKTFKNFLPFHCFVWISHFFFVRFHRWRSKITIIKLQFSDFFFI